MRQLTAHKANGLNEAINITVLDEPGAGGAHHAYELSGAGKTVRLEFQHGPIKEAGLNGISNEALLAIVADRLECFQAGPFACKDNEDALGMVKGGLSCLLKRTKKRVDQGVEGTNVQHAEPPALVKFTWQIKDGDKQHGLFDSTAAAVADAAEYLKEDGPTEIEIFDCRPATAADAELFAGIDHDEVEEIDTTKPDWFVGRWVPENVVLETKINAPLEAPKPATKGPKKK